MPWPRVAAALPRHGVTAFCPTTIACAPAALERFLVAVDAAVAARPAGAARVLGAHLESNFLNPDYNGAQPAVCLRRPPRPGEPVRYDGDFTGAAIVAVIDAHRPSVRLVTLAPGTRRRARPHRPAGRGRPSRVARALGRHLRTGRSGDRRRRAPCHASLQPHAAAGPSRARARRRGARPRRGDERGDLRRLPRAPGDGAARRARQGRGRRAGDHRRAPPAPACRSAP